MPIIATASSRPAPRNLGTRSTGNSSGWRAEPSMKRPPRMPKPMAVPRAPMPKMMPTASTVMASMCAMFSMQISSTTNTKTLWHEPRPAPSVMLVRHRQIDDRQHREYEGLDQDNEYVKDRPGEPEHELPDDPQPATHGREAPESVRQRQSREQQENHLAGVQVAVQAQRQRHRAGEEGDRLEDEVHRHQQRLHQHVPGAEGLQGQLTDEADQSLHLQAVEDDEDEDREGQAERRIQVRARHDLQVLEAGAPRRRGQQVDRHQ